MTRAMLAIVITTLFNLPADAQRPDPEAVTEGIYVCKQLHAVRLGENGRLNHIDTANPFYSSAFEFMVDTVSGVIRYKGAAPESLSSLAAPARRLGFRSHAQLRRDARRIQVLSGFARMQPWRKPVTFIMIAENDIITGTCVPQRH